MPGIDFLFNLKKYFNSKAINEIGTDETEVKILILGPGSPPDQIIVRPVLSQILKGFIYALKNIQMVLTFIGNHLWF